MIIGPIIFQPYERMNIADALFSKTFEAGDVIITQVRTAERCNFVMALIITFVEGLAHFQ